MILLHIRDTINGTVSSPTRIEEILRALVAKKGIKKRFSKMIRKEGREKIATYYIENI